MRLYCGAHGVRTGLGLWLLSAALILTAHDTVLSVDVLTSRPGRLLPVGELIAVATATTLPAVTYPQMWTWEQLLRRRTLQIAGAAHQATWLTMLGLLPLSIPLISDHSMSNWAGSSANVVLIGSLSATGMMLMGRAAGPLTGIACYLALIALQQASSELYSVLPLADFSGDRDPAWAVASGLGAAASLLAGATLGRARLVQNLTANDDEP